MLRSGDAKNAMRSSRDPYCLYAQYISCAVNFLFIYLIALFFNLFSYSFPI